MTAWVFTQMEQIRRDICDFKVKSGVDKVIVLWTANTERFSDVVTGVSDTAKNLLATIQVTDRHIMYSTDLNTSSGTSWK